MNMVRGLRGLRLAMALRVLLAAVAIGGLAATANPASAQTIDCTLSGNTLSWTPTSLTAQIRARQSPGGASTWIASVSGANNNSYVITAADRAKVPSGEFFPRFRISGEVVDSAGCQVVPPPPNDALACVQNGSELTWGQLDVSRDVFFVRQIDAGGNNSWVATVPASDSNSFSGASDPVGYEIRYRITSSPGNTTVFNVPCNPDDTPPPPNTITCSISSFGFLQEGGLDVAVNGAANGESFTLFLNGESVETGTFPVDAVDFIGRDANEIFRLDGESENSELTVVAVARTNDLASRFSCGSFGQDAFPVATCSVDENGFGDQGPGQVSLVVTPGRLTPFEVAVDGVITEITANNLGFPPFTTIDWTVDAPITSTFTIIQDAGNIECSGTRASFCIQDGGELDWIDVADLWNSEFNVRRINPDGSTSWVRTTSNRFADVGEGDFLIRYRTVDAAGNRTVFNETCSPA